MSDAFETRYDHLPPELQAGLQKFVVWSNERLLRTEQYESTPTGPLYHYTDDVALRGILTNQHVWCFSHLHQRDKTEFAYSLEIAREVIRTVGWSDDGFKRAVCGLIEDMLEENSIEETFEFYLFSLTRHRDDHEHWLQYGKEGEGFAIGFAPPLLQPDKDVLSDKANENLHVGRIVYGDVKTRARHRLIIERAADITSEYGHANSKLGREQLAPFIRAMADEVIASQLIWNCMTAKSATYENEREVRGVIMNVRANFDGIRKPLGGKFYVEHDLPLREPGSITEIIVGPLAPADAEETVRMMLGQLGYPHRITVTRSSLIL
jgi:Protein of unknown function (DUF2971)